MNAMSSDKQSVLLVDDEPHICEVIRLYVEHAGFICHMLHRGEAVIDWIQLNRPSLILLDIMLPDMNGFDLCQRIRALGAPCGQTPLIMLTAKGESIDKLRGFHLGVDDYIVKPFDPNELVARMKAVLRRAATGRHVVEGSRATGTISLRGLVIDIGQYKVTVQGQRVELTPKEIELLHFLASSPNRVYTREDLLGHVWNFDFSGGTRTVDAHVKNLRKKLGVHPGWAIQTIWGVGYYFEVPAHD